MRIIGFTIAVGVDGIKTFAFAKVYTDLLVGGISNGFGCSRGRRLE